MHRTGMIVFAFGFVIRSPEDARRIVEAMDPKSRREAVAEGFARATFDAIADNILSEDERRSLRTAFEAFQPEPSDSRVMDANAAIAHAPAVAEILAHRIPSIASTVPPGVILQPDERLVWAVAAYGVEGTLEMRTEIRFESVGVPLGDAIYYSASSGRSVSRLHRGVGRSGAGHLVFTTKHIMFVGDATTVRFAFATIMRIVPAEDGFVLQIDSRASPFFVVRLARRADAWLAANLAANLPRALHRG